MSRGRGLLSLRVNDAPPGGDTEYRSKLRTHPRPTQRFITLQEALHCETITNARNFVILPPENANQDVATDEESISDEDDFPEPVGEVELEEEDTDSCSETDEEQEYHRW